MRLTAWRVFKSKFADDPFSGEGARRFGGRWSSKGTRIVYTAQSAALAVLEVLARLKKSDFLSKFCIASILFNESLVESLALKTLPKNWRTNPEPVATQAIGDQWILEGRSAVLRVPSVMVDGEWNYLLNPDHPDFRKCKVGSISPFRFDPRLAK